MRRLTIKNVGPIKSVCIDLKRINVLIGLQSSGKSTINKIACYCSWVEKEIFINQDAEDFLKEGYFEENLIEFHKLEGFISNKSVIEFETNVIKFTFTKKDNTFLFTWKSQDKKLDYKRIKTIYIPTERNIIAVIPNWFDIKLDNSNLRSFMSDWQEARNFYSKTPFSILNLGINYKYNQKLNTDELILDQNNTKINFKNASSGLHSLIPLYTLIEYSTKGLFENFIKGSLKQSLIKLSASSKGINFYRENYMTEIKSRINIQSIKNNILNNLNTDIHSKHSELEDELDILLKQEIENEIEKIVNNKDIITEIDNKIENKLNKNLKNINLFNKYHNIIDYDLLEQFITPQQSNIFLEEPEVNLFPVTQRDLVKYLVRSTYHNEQGREHSLFLTTHSPYILTTLNNLIYANECTRVNKESVKEIIGEDYWVDFNNVGVWFVKDGVVEDILDYELKQIDAIKIDDVSRILNEEFDNLLNTQHHEV